MNLWVMGFLLTGLVVCAVVCVTIRNLLKAAIALSVMSAILAIIMFLLEAPLAGVFELSVCAGLVTVVFISAISMTRLHSKEDLAEREKERRWRFSLLPVCLALALTGILFWIWPHLSNLIPNVATPIGAATEQEFFWDERQADILGQIVVVLVGVFGVLIFFKEKEREGE